MAAIQRISSVFRTIRRGGRPGVFALPVGFDTLHHQFLVARFSLFVGLTLALVLRDLTGRLKWLRAIIILPWAVSAYCAGILFANMGRGQTGLGTAVAALFGSTSTLNLVTANGVVEYFAVGAAWNMAPLLAFSCSPI